MLAAGSAIKLELSSSPGSIETKLCWEKTKGPVVRDLSGADKVHFALARWQRRQLGAFGSRLHRSFWSWHRSQDRR